MQDISRPKVWFPYLSFIRTFVVPLSICSQGCLLDCQNNSTGRLAATSNILRNFIHTENPASY